MPTTLDRTETIVSRFEEFNAAWNLKDLSTLSQYISYDVVYNNPPIRTGLFSLNGRQVFGKFNLLKFWKKYHAKFPLIKEEQVILRIAEDDTGFSVACDVHNYNLEVSSKAYFRFNEELLIDSIEFTNITELKGDKELSVLSLQLKQLKKYFNKQSE